MKRFLCTFVFFAFSADAGERYLGTLTSTGTAVTNATTATPFVITPVSKLTIQCDAASYIATDATTVTSSNGLKLNADVALPTSTGGQNPTTISSVPTARVAMISSSGTTNCKVFDRSGKE